MATTASTWYDASSLSPAFLAAYHVGSTTPATSATSATSATATGTTGVATTPAPGTTDPSYLQLSGMYGAQSVEDAQKRQQAIQRALIDYGGVPDFSGTGLDPNFLGNDVTDLVKQLAAQNTTAGLSQTARFEHDHLINQRQIQDQLAARGMMQSGELPYQIGEEGLQYKQLQYGAMQQLIDYINGANAAYAQGERDRSMGLYNAQHDAAIRQQDLAFQTQQAQLDLAYQQQQLAADAAANAAAQASYDQYVADQQQQTAGAAGPNAQQLAQMAAAVPRKASQRTAAELALFAQFAQWRAENPNWWK